jgi:DNA end-binding protein Ku
LGLVEERIVQPAVSHVSRLRFVSTAMAMPKPFWKGFLKLSLVTCPVAMMPAISQSEKVRFHTLNRATGNRVRSRYIDAETEKPVEEGEEVKGYERGEGDYVMLEDEELESVALESTRTIDVDMFVEKESIDWVWYDTAYYVTPDGEVGEEAFSVIRDAMAATGMVGVSRVVLNGRERAVMLEPRDRGIVAWTLRFGDEVRDPNLYFADINSEKHDPNLTTLVATLIDEKTKPWSPAFVSDPVQDRLLEIIASKKKGKRPSKPKAAPERPHNVVSIFEALKKSIAEEGKRPRRA